MPNKKKVFGWPQKSLNYLLASHCQCRQQHSVLTLRMTQKMTVTDPKAFSQEQESNASMPVVSVKVYRHRQVYLSIHTNISNSTKASLTFFGNGFLNLLFTFVVCLNRRNIQRISYILG